MVLSWGLSVIAACRSVPDEARESRGIDRFGVPSSSSSSSSSWLLLVVGLGIRRGRREVRIQLSIEEEALSANPLWDFGRRVWGCKTTARSGVWVGVAGSTIPLGFGRQAGTGHHITLAHG